MSPISADRCYAGLRECTAKFAEIVSGDLARPVPTCPEWTFKQLATHVGRGHRWAAEIVATRSPVGIPMGEVPDGRLPGDPVLRAAWLNGGASQVITAVMAAGDAPVWTFIGTRPASFWARRRAHESAVHLADAQLAAGRQVELAADLAADGIGEWLEIVAAGAAAAAATPETALARPEGVQGDGQTLHFHATDAGLDGAGEWLATRTPAGVTVEPGHGKADVAVRGPAASLLLVLTRRLPPADPAIEIIGDEALFTHWLDHTPF